NKYGFSAAVDIVRWAGLMAICGPDFPEASEHASYRTLLQQPGMLPAQRLDAVRLEAQRQALAHSKESIACPQIDSRKLLTWSGPTKQPNGDFQLTHSKVR